MDWIPQTLKMYGGRILGAICLVLVMAVAVFELEKLVRVSPEAASISLSLSLLAIGGVILLISLLAVVAMIFSTLGLTDKDEAMGLPEGSIRAVIALSLIVLFAILSVFLYQGVSRDGQLNTVQRLSDAERAEFMKNHPNALDLQSVVATDTNGQPIKNPDGTALYNVTYRSANATSDDFAKQLLVLLGTLMTAITSFYLGAGTATSAAAAVQPGDSPDPPPTLSNINPATHSIAAGVLHLEIMGNNLNIITHVRIVRGSAQVIGTNVASSPTHVTCDIAVGALTPGPPPWDVVVDDGGSNSATLPGALTITA